MQVRATDKQISEIFNSNYYKIPRFQRPYSWDNENITEFWNDVIVNSSTESDYFIGAIVLFNDEHNFKGIVDGQQRLTTIVIFLSALREIFKKYEFINYSQGVQTIIERKNIDNKAQFVISTESSYPYFQQTILSYLPSDIETNIGPEEKNIENAYSYFFQNLDKSVQSILINPAISTENKNNKIEEELLEIRRKILSLKIIVVELDDEDDAYVIFETLNTRGKDLTITDLLRNYFTKNIQSENTESDIVKLKWEKILTTINDTNCDLKMDNFLHHHWLSNYSYVSLKKLFKEINKEIPPNKVKDYLNDLVNDSKLYRQIFENSYRTWLIDENDIKESFYAYNIFNVKQHVPIVLSLFKKYDKKLVKLRLLKRLVIAIENFHFIYTAITSSRSTGGMAQMYSSYAIRITTETETQKIAIIVEEFIKKLSTKIPSLEEFRVNFKEFIYTENNTKHKSLIKYILSKYDKKLRKDNIIDYSKMSIEHLYSQSNYSKRLDENIFGMIGNLILVDKELNSSKLKNKNFSEKKNILINSKYPLDEILLDCNDLTEDIIRRRTDLIAEIGYNEIWKI